MLSNVFGKQKRAASQPPFLSCQEMQWLPGESDQHLNDAVANRVCGVPEIGVRQSPGIVKREVQALVTIEERPVSVVQEVIAREAELKLSGLRLPESKILEQGHVSIKESRARQCRENVGTLLAGRNRRREAGTVDVLVRLEAASRVAGQCGH